MNLPSTLRQVKSITSKLMNRILVTGMVNECCFIADRSVCRNPKRKTDNVFVSFSLTENTSTETKNTSTETSNAVPSFELVDKTPSGDQQILNIRVFM